MTNMKLFLAYVVGMFFAVVWLSVSGCAGVSCHPGQHVCQTDAECEDEEAYLLDMDEGRQR